MGDVAAVGGEWADWEDGGDVEAGRFGWGRGGAAVAVAVAVSVEGRVLAIVTSRLWGGKGALCWGCGSCCGDEREK